MADFWQRAQAMGVGAVILREESLGALARRGRLLMFSREEIERWRAGGLASPAAPLKVDTLWIKDPGVFDEVLGAALRYGVAVSTSALPGYHLARLPEALAASGTLADAPLGVYDAELVKALEGRRLAQIRVPYKNPAEALGPARSLSVEAPNSAVLRAVYSHPSRVLVFRLTAPGLEPNFDRLRGLLQELKRRGLPLGASAKISAGAPALEPTQRRLVRLLIWFFGIFGPLLAARAGLTALKRVRVMAHSRWPVATPVVQIAAGLIIAALSAAVVGLAARSCFASLGVEGQVPLWASAALIGPLVIAFLTLYTIDLEEWRQKLSLPVTYGAALKLLALLGFAALLIEPRRLLLFFHLETVGPRLEAAVRLPWWWSWRWREILIGWPCLAQAFFLINRRMDCPDCDSAVGGFKRDPRFWFVLGLLAPIGVMVSLGQELAPRELALEQTLWSALAGFAIGTALILARSRRLNGTKADLSQEKFGTTAQ